MNGIKRVSTAKMSREEWLECRRHTLGGSDAAAVVGLSHYASPYTVFMDKTGRLPDQPDSEAMRQGRDLEDYVAKRWCEETGKKVRRVQAMLYHPQYPFAHADVDRMVVGENAGLECKTTSALDVKQFRGGEFPERYYAQCVHYLAITGAARWHLAVLVFGRGFFTYTLERDQAEIDALMNAERDFWELVESGTPPAPDGSEATTEAIQTVYAGSREESVELFGREALAREYLRLKEERKGLDAQIREIENTLKEELQEAETGCCGSYTITWKPQQRSTFQREVFSKYYPEIDLSPFYKHSSTRVFKLKED